jgi:hypothetical protein
MVRSERNYIFGINLKNEPRTFYTLETHCRGNLIIERIEEKIKQKQKNFIHGFMLRRKVERPTYEKLIDEIENLGLEGVGRKYGVTGKAIKKWVITYQKYNI